MFDYEKFENNLVQQMEIIWANWIKENGDIYIFSLDCARGMDSVGVIANTARYLAEQAEDDSSEYWFYKYCEEEWELYHTFEEISVEMSRFLDENRSVLTDPETFEYTEIFDEHCEKIIERCVNALIRLRKFLGENQSDIILNFNIREYLDGEDRIAIFEKLNGRNAVKEYAEYITEFE